ncbi:YoaK family protein [Streptomyces viridiviolaceus]|uniref:YoaK family protein n=1 Tax=Streptomyces viridiviolaceus TaxID=68282 RepID=A0ABW2DS20_9ACTN|nr:YoaK family protein [Streptomyces viridiviolaceus]
MPETPASPPGGARPPDVRLTVVMTVLTVLAGAVDAVSFLTMGKVFCALATGNVLFLAFALAGEGEVPVERPATALGAFMAGAAVGAVVLSGLAARGRPWFALGVACEGVLLAVAGGLAWGWHGTGSPGDDSGLVIVATVGVAMGLRTVGALRVHVPGMPTLLIQTVIAQLIDDVLKQPRTALRGMTYRQRLSRARWTATAVGIFVGGVLGTLLLVPLGTGPALVVIAALVLLLAAVTLVARLQEPAGP